MGVPEKATPAIDAPAFRQALIKWYRVHRRRLPWRENPSLYKTVLSEFMLQQTQVKTVLPYFDRWLREFPDFAELASASEEGVLKQWEGLGYYSRARNLHRLAKAVAALPEPPRTPEEWLELPGVGPYTAAAITSIAFSVPVPCVDGNVVRILARITADSTPFRDSASAAKAFTPLARQLVSTETPGDHNQAMMELGATICVRSTPLCTICPVLSFCAAARSGAPEAFPKLATKKIEQVSVARLWCEHEGRLLLHRTHAKARRLANLHELPKIVDTGLPAERFTNKAPLAIKRRSITRYAITETIYRAELTAAQRATIMSAPELSWVPLGELSKLTLSGPHRRWITELLGK